MQSHRLGQINSYVREVYFCAFLAFFVSLCSSLAFAAADGLVGPEFNFSHPRLVHFPLGAEGRRRFAEMQMILPTTREYRETTAFAQDFFNLCKPNCKLTRESYSKYSHDESFIYKFVFPDGFQIDIFPDLYNVEVTHNPVLASQLHAQRERLDMIFSVARRRGLWTHSPVPDLPINANYNFDLIGFFDNNPKKFLAFFVDFVNNLEIAQALGSNRRYAPMFSLLPDGAYLGLERLIEQVNNDQFKTAVEVAEQINKTVYIGTTFTRATITHAYNQALSFKHTTLSGATYRARPPMEFRSPRMADNTEDYFLFVQLIVARINYVNTLTESGQPIQFLHRRQRSFSSRQSVDAVYRYVTESGLDWPTYRVLLKRHLRSITPTELSRLCLGVFII